MVQIAAERARAPLSSAVVGRGDGRLLHRPRRQRAGARLHLFRGRAGTAFGGTPLTRDEQRGLPPTLLKPRELNTRRFGFERVPVLGILTMPWPGPAKLLRPQGSSGHRASAGVEFAEAHPFSYPHPFWTNVTLVTECWLARCHLTAMRGQLRFELAWSVGAACSCLVRTHLRFCAAQAAKRCTKSSKLKRGQRRSISK